MAGLGHNGGVATTPESDDRRATPEHDDRQAAQLQALRARIESLERQQKQASELQEQAAAAQQEAAAAYATGLLLVAAVAVTVVGLFLPWYVPRASEEMITAAEAFDGAVIGWALLAVEPWPWLTDGPAESRLVAAGLLLIAAGLLATLVLAVVTGVRGGKRLVSATLAVSLLAGVSMVLLIWVWGGLADTGPAAGYFTAMLGVAAIAAAAGRRVHQLEPPRADGPSRAEVHWLDPQFSPGWRGPHRGG